MRLYFIRHGQSTNNSLLEETGSNEGRHSDPDLSTIGKQQVKHLAEYFNSQPSHQEYYPNFEQNRSGYLITQIYTSLMIRAVITGTAIAEKLGLPLFGSSDIHELGGIYDTDEVSGQPIGLPGKKPAYFKTRFPSLVIPQDTNLEGWWNRPYETEEQRVSRSYRFLNFLLEHHSNDDDSVIIVSHAGFYNLFLKLMLSAPLTKTSWFQINNTGISRIDFTPEWTSIVYQNRVCHLPPELFT